MCDAYRVSSSVKVEQMEAELSRQLSGLRAEIEESGFPQRAGPSRCHSSVLPPKDVPFFRAERELVLRRGLQVAEALPVQSQADIMQRELDSCLSLEYTPDSLPLLLHQFFADRSYHLAQIKYLLMLRWRRFCRHTSVIEKLYPHYKDQVSYLSREYEDAVQRARRLSASREGVLTGRGDPADLLSEGDVLLYLRWLVCHLHSVQSVHSFLRVLHYLPAGERREKEPKVDEEASHEADGLTHANVPLHSAHLEDFLPELQALIAHFRLSYDARNLSTTADEMELFGTVWSEFRTTFGRQEQMRTFPQDDGSEVRRGRWGGGSASSAVRKEANWISFIQVKPRRDPWRQKFVTKLKEKKCVDELLKMHSRFLQVPELLRVAAGLKEHAARVQTSSETKRLNISDIWRSVYSAAALNQETRVQSTRSRGGRNHDVKSFKRQNATNGSLQLLGLGRESSEEGTSNPAVTRGAYLSLTHLRHLRLRQLQRVSLGLLNYLRSVERTLTFDLAGLRVEDGEPRGTAEETGWMSAARGGRGAAGGLGSLQCSFNTPVDFKVRCSEFMEFAEVENLHDFYSADGPFIHTQDHRGLYVVYDAALRDLDQLEDELLLVGSRFIRRIETGTEVDHVAVLLDLWTCEAEFLQKKVQLLDCYYEAYQHAAGAEERFALARVVTDIMHRRPQLDLNQDYFVQAYRAETGCLQSHRQLIADILDNQILKQRQHLQHIWTDDRKGSAHDYGLPPNYAPKHLVSLGGGSPALMNVFLLEVHPSLCLASAVYDALDQAHAEVCRLHRAASAAHELALRQKLLRRALQSWSNLASPGAAYSSQIQKDLFSGVFFEHPMLVQSAGLSWVRSAEERDVTRGRERRAVETFCTLLELVTIRHRLLEAASETAHLAQLYRNVASELGFQDFHLYLRPVQFEAAEPSADAEERPVFFTRMLEGDSCVDRFSPSHLPLSIQEVDEKEIGRFSFGSEEAVIRLMNRRSVENLQVTLACQVTQKNALMGAVKLACVCHWADGVTPPAEFSLRSLSTPRQRLSEAFVSIQLEKAGLRDEMLSSFVRGGQAAGGLMKTPEEAAAIKRRLVIDFIKKFSAQISQYCVRAQIVAYYYDLTFLLDGVPSVRQTHFMMGRDSGAETGTSESLLSADGKTLLNLWLIPHFSQVLRVFRTLDVTACAAALRHTLQIVSALHDIVYYLVGFSRLGNTEEESCRSGPGGRGSLAADWGGAEGVGAELQEIQRQVQRLPDPCSPESVGRLLQLRRQVLLLQFDTAVRHLVREVFLSSGDAASFQSVSDNAATALPLLSDSIQTDVSALALPVPQPLEAGGRQAQRMYPWRSFTACQGLLPLHVWDVPPIESCMQLCLSGLRDRCRLQANAAFLGVSLLMEDVLASGREAEPVRLHGDKDDEGDEQTGLQGPVRVQSVLKGFLLLTKQLQVFKESWARRRLQSEKLYRSEIFFPSMRALAQQMGKAQDYEVLISGSRQSLLPPPGASDVDVKVWQLHRLLESCECDMIRAVQRRINGELTLAMSERTRRDTVLPTELWRKAPLKHSFSPERPQIVEAFVQQLMDGAEDDEGQLRISAERLQRCLAHLGSALMERERRSFLLHSQFYEQILQQETRLLYEREQDLKNLEDSQTNNRHQEVAAACRGMMLEISALKASVARLEQEKRSLEEKLALKFKERYEPLVRHLFSTCVQLKARLEASHQQMEQDVSVMVSRVRREGVQRIIELKKKHGCTKDHDGLARTLSEREEVHELQLENGRLAALLCKLKALSSWKQLVDQERLQRRLLHTQQREISCRSEALGVKMASGEEVVVLQAELEAARRELTRCQSECSSTKKLLGRKAEELQASRRQSAQEAVSRQELDGYRVQRLEQMRADVEDGERRLRALSEELERGGRMNQIHRRRSAKEIRQVRMQLQQELRLKQEAFQQVDRLQNAAEASGRAAGPSRTRGTPSVSRLSGSAGASVLPSSQSRLQPGGLSGTHQESAAEPRHPRPTARGRRSARTDGPGADPAGLRVLTADTMFPDL